MSNPAEIASILLIAKKLASTARRVNEIEAGLASLARQPGPRGDTGERGPQGQKGDPGPQGEPGRIPAHQWQGTKLRFTNPDGTWGKAVDLIGPDGETGKAGAKIIIARAGGSSSTDLAALTPGNSTEPASLVVMQAGKPVALPWSAFLALVGGASDGQHTRRVDFVGESLMYRGEAAPGADESAPVWRIKRIEFSVDGDVTELWANGTADFVHAWSERAGLAYS